MSSIVQSQPLESMQSLVLRLVQLGSFPAKLSFWTLLLLNIAAFPGLWHFWTVWPWTVFNVRKAMGKKWHNHRIGKDVYEQRESRTFRATPDKCDAFGFHMSNSSYSSCADILRGPGTVSLIGEFFALPNAFFALGSTSLKFAKEIGIMQRFTTTNQLVGYDKKWLYTLQTFTSVDPKTGADVVHCTILSQIVLKINRRTVPPSRALALAGYGTEHGARNWAIVKTMNAREKKEWLYAGEGEHDKWGIVVGTQEEHMEKKHEWPGAL